MQENGAGQQSTQKPISHLYQAAFEDIAVVGGLVFVFAFLGIWTRPIGLLAGFWPANAVLLALFVRNPRRTSAAGIVAAIGAYVAADMLTGASWSFSLLLTFGNFAGITVGYILFMHVEPEHRRLKRPKSVLYMALIACAASIAAGLVGAIINSLLLHGSALAGLHYWFITELVNYLAVLPAALTLPQWGSWRHDQRSKSSGGLHLLRQEVSMGNGATRFSLEQYLPLLVLLVGIVMTALMDGPGAIAFIVPGLLWCALVFSVFRTAVITLLASTWLLLAVSGGFLNFGLNDGALVYTQQLLESVRMGISLVVLAPLSVACATNARNELLFKLERAATHDQLTGVLNRKGFNELSLRLFDRLLLRRQVVTALMLDIDHFKKVNDTYGHAVGDLVLVGFVELAANCLRESDIIGRMGGEEFAVLLPDTNAEVGSAVAQRICDKFSAKKFLLPDGVSLQVTVSIGVSRTCVMPITLESLLSNADDALYQAKKNGRNQVQIALPEELLTQAQST